MNIRSMLLLLLFASGTAAAADPATRIAHFVDEALALGYNPALAVAVVRGDDDVLVDARGRVDVGHRAPDAATRFYIASATKSLTGLAAAALAESGRLDLEASLAAVTDVRPPEGLPAERFAVGALLTHTHGLDNMPLVIRTAYSGQHDAALLAALLPQSRYSGNDDFDYSNVGYNVFGLALAQLEGTPDWRGAVRRLVLDPLRLSDTTAYLSRVPADAIALPFTYEPETGLQRMPLYKTDRTLHAAGGHFMSARDATRWLRANLAEGVVDGERLLPAEVFHIAHASRVESGETFGEYRREHYGLGWHRARYDGDVLVHHFGSFAGYRSHISFMPERGIGVAVFTNTTGPGFPVVDIVANYAYDVLRGLPDADERGAKRLEAHVQRTAERMAGRKEHLAERRTRRSHLSLPLAAYGGQYVSRVLGHIDVSPAGDRLLFRLGDVTSLSEPFEQPESVRVELPPGSGRVARFAVADGAVVALELQGTRFERVPVQ